MLASILRAILISSPDEFEQETPRPLSLDAVSLLSRDAPQLNHGVVSCA